MNDRRLIHEALSQSAAFNAYAISYLDAGLFPLASFYLAEAGQTRAVLMHARGGLGTATHVFGDAKLARVLIDLHPGPRSTLLTCETGHVDEMLTAYNLWRPQAMLRMRTDRNSFLPPAARGPVRRLLAADARELNQLYSLEGDGLPLSGRHIREGVYYGALHRGRLVAAAGTHILSKSARTAVVGNVFTHPDFRRHGLGTAVTAAVTAQLLEECDLVVLSVDPANRPARHIYEGLGYRDDGRIMEAMATRRSPLSPLPLVRRLIASQRAGERDSEVVLL
jgi:RimJ/RimL family protein N-acetyltransferase